MGLWIIPEQDEVSFRDDGEEVKINNWPINLNECTTLCKITVKSMFRILFVMNNGRTETHYYICESSRDQAYSNIIKKMSYFDDESTIGLLKIPFTWSKTLRES